MEEFSVESLGHKQAFAKFGFYGFAGSGKTTTASLVAVGLHRHIKSQKPVFFLDTESGSDFVYDIFKQNGVELVGRKSKSFADLLLSLDYVEKNCDIMIIDSVSHIWDELRDAYRLKKYACDKCAATGTIGDKVCYRCDGTKAVSDNITVYDYAPIKKEWRNSFVERMLNMKAHVFICGRATNEYDSQENLKGKLEIIKTGSKMRAESEFGFEVSLLVEMEKEMIEKGIVNKAIIHKDKFMNCLNGKEFLMPKFEDFLPHISRLNLGGDHISIEQTSSVDALKSPKWSTEEYQKQRTILLEEIQAIMTLAYPSAHSSEEKKLRLDSLKTAFNTHSWTEIENMKIDQLKTGYDLLIRCIDKKQKDSAEIKKQVEEVVPSSKRSK